ncbi:hypothetical protein Tco_0708391 [Tanacetum coccineum]
MFACADSGLSKKVFIAFPNESCGRAGLGFVARNANGDVLLSGARVECYASSPYRQAPQPARYSVDQYDREILGNDHLDEDEEHFIGICLQDPQTEHIPCDICFCKDCLNEARILEEEPLNKAKRSNKPKRSKQRYDAPINTTPIEEIAATGWGDEKVTIFDEKKDWDDDKRSGGKILVLQEQFSHPPPPL